jgi:hypothetical protein
MEPKSKYGYGVTWEEVLGDLYSYYKDKPLGAIDHVDRDGYRQEEGPDKDDLEILNLLKGYLAKYLEQFFENPDDVIREALKARDEEIKRLENKIKELEGKIDNLLLRIPTPIPPEEWPNEPYKDIDTTTPLNPIWYGGGIGVTLGSGTAPNNII